MIFDWLVKKLKQPELPVIRKREVEIILERGKDFYDLKSDGNPVCRFIEVKGGSFNMGKDGNQQNVILSSFYIAEYAVTQELYEAVTGGNPSYFKGIERPVETVSWYDVVEFCNLLSEAVGVTKCYEIDKRSKDPDNKSKYDNQKWIVKMIRSSGGFRLPTEAEWEYAARGGNRMKETKDFRFAGSDDLNLIGWYRENSHQETKPVGMKFPNALGLYDMSGNVWEWCRDWLGESSKANLTDPTGAAQGEYRVIRGGSWYYVREWCTPVYRIYTDPSNRHYDLGCRLVYVP